MTSVSAVPRACIFRVHVCVWMIQQLVQLQSVSAARAHSQLTGENKHTQGAFILVSSAKLTVSQPVQVKAHVGEAGQRQRRGRTGARRGRAEAAPCVRLTPPCGFYPDLSGLSSAFVRSQTLSGRTEPRHIPPDIQLLSFNRPTPTFPHFDV